MMVRLLPKGRVWQGSDKEIHESQGVRRAVLRDWLGLWWPMSSMPPDSLSTFHPPWYLGRQGFWALLLLALES